MRPNEVVEIIAPIVAERRKQPQDDLISVLVEAEIVDDEGITHRLTDVEIYSFALLLLAAGSGTTWKQMGITLTAMLTRPVLLEAVQADRALLRPVIEESLRWMPTDPTFPAGQLERPSSSGSLAKGSVVHLCLASGQPGPFPLGATR